MRSRATDSRGVTVSQPSTRVVRKDNGYFVVVATTCCGQEYRVDTEDLQYGSGKAERVRKATSYAVRNHEC